MNTQKHLTVILIFWMYTLAYGQTTGLNEIYNKYNVLLKEQKQGVGLLVKKGETIETTSLGMYDLNANHVFNIGSATKTFTVVMLLQEMEKGNLSLKDSIGQYLSPIRHVNGALTIETLMVHESGLDGIIGRNIEPIFYAKNDSLYTAPLINELGEPDTSMIGRFDYCNTNYILLGKILENVTDQSYFDLLRQRIFEPLAMGNTYPYVSKSIPNLATPYHNNEDVTEYLDYRFYANIAHSAGSIASTLNDMRTFYKALFETEQLLKKETLERMLSSGSKHYGLGLEKFEIDGVTHYGHGGNNIGYAFRNLYNPETGNLYLMFTNSHRMPMESAISDDILFYFNDKAISSAAVEIETAKFEGFVGKYDLKEAGIVLEIVMEGDQMFMIGPDTKDVLIQKSDSVLYELSHGVALERIPDNTDKLKFTQNGYETKIFRVKSKE